MLKRVEYIWIDGVRPTPRLRSKVRIIDYKPSSSPPEWNFDGSSTEQASGEDSDVKLVPVFSVLSPFQHSDYLVLCECMTHDDQPIESNTRALLREKYQEIKEEYDPWIGFEQEYVIYSPSTMLPLGFPHYGFPKPQGPYYCGVDGDVCFGRDISELHAQLCMKAGLMIYGTNAEVMPGQWEFQLGLRGVESDRTPDPLEMADQLTIARYILFRVAEPSGNWISLDCKPINGDWNGSGCHTNFSTKQMRGEGGYEAIIEAIKRLEEKHDEHIGVYGAGLADRLTGLHETCNITEFKWGVADRGCSIRIPHAVEVNQKGYFEDRRPGANIDPYLVGWRLLETVCA